MNELHVNVGKLAHHFSQSAYLRKNPVWAVQITTETEPLLEENFLIVQRYILLMKKF